MSQEPRDVKSAADVIGGAFARHDETLRATQAVMPAILAGAEVFAQAITRGHRLFVCGNGGSAADSQHFAAELTSRYRAERHPLPAMALTTDTSALTAIGNDYGFDQVFARQIQGNGSEGDVLVALTTSGSSKNILLAIDAAKEKKMKVIMLTGANGANLAGRVDVCVAIPSDETARIQEMHELIYHAWCEYLDTVL